MSIAAERQPIGDESHERIIRRYFDEVWNRGRIEVLDEILTADYINHSPGLPDPVPGPAGLKPIVTMMRDAIPDLHYTILDLVVAAGKAAVYTRVTGMPRGDLFGIRAAGRAFDVRQMQIEWFRDGRICQHWRLTDERRWFEQLGA